MTTYQTTYLYTLDENGASTTGKVDGLVPNGSGTAVESVDDSMLRVGETFDVTFDHPVTNTLYGGTYTYMGHATPFSGYIGESGGEYYMFSSDVIPIGTNLNGFVPEDMVVCFAEGTRIMTPSGEVPVETLRAGDLVITPCAEQRVQPLRWVGHRRIDVIHARDRAAVAPVLLRAGALGPGMPSRDLRVSPEHAFLIQGRLVPARLLVDGVSILQETWCRSITYWHLELERHGILVADGALAESYFDDGNRQFFDNPGLVALWPNFDRAPGSRYATHACAPPILDAADPALAAMHQFLRRAA